MVSLTHTDIHRQTSPLSLIEFNTYHTAAHTKVSARDMTITDTVVCSKTYDCEAEVTLWSAVTTMTNVQDKSGHQHCAVLVLLSFNEIVCV